MLIALGTTIAYAYSTAVVLLGLPLHLYFEASTTINRLDYGVAWNRAVEGGGATLGDDVKIELTIAATRRTTPASGQ